MFSPLSFILDCIYIFCAIVGLIIINISPYLLSIHTFRVLDIMGYNLILNIIFHLIILFCVFILQIEYFKNSIGGSKR